MSKGFDLQDGLKFSFNKIDFQRSFPSDLEERRCGSLYVSLRKG